MDENFNDTFDYSDIIPLNYKSKTALISEFDEIYKNTENTKIDWRRRELAKKKQQEFVLGIKENLKLFYNFLMAKYILIQIFNWLIYVLL